MPVIELSDAPADDVPGRVHSSIDADGLPSDPEELYKMRFKVYDSPCEVAEEGWRCLKKAADLGHAEAAFFLGRLSFDGSSSTAAKKALHYLKKAADLGHAEAAFTVASVLRDWYGFYGIPQNRTEAAHYFKIAADLGYTWGN
jgi:TPR repeat protein